MQNTLQAHILHLEHKIQESRDQLTNPALTPAERTRMQSEMEIAELALNHYVKAFELEQKIA